MAIAILAVTEKFISLIHEAQGADNKKLKELRKKFIQALGIIGREVICQYHGGYFKRQFSYPGAVMTRRIPLQEYFNISLDGLEESLLTRTYHLPKEHPLSGLSLGPH